jgi:hypothetical protein
LVLVLVLAISIVVFTSDDSSNLSQNGRTLGDIEAKINEYILSKYPDMTIGSGDYINYLCEQLMFGSDKEAKKLDYYEDFLFYGSYYLASAYDQNLTEEVEVDGNETILRFKDSVKKRLVDDIRRELEEAELNENAIIGS